MKDFLNFLLALACTVLLARWIYLSLRLWMVYRRELPTHSTGRTGKFYQKTRYLHWLTTVEPNRSSHHHSSAIWSRPPSIRAQLPGMKTIPPTTTPDPQTGRRPRSQDEEIAGHPHRTRDH